MDKLANILRYSARITFLILGILVFIFGLLSGAEEYGGGLMGIIKNSPNALPSLGLLLLSAAAWKYELIGGLGITAFGLFLIYFFNFSGNNFFLVTFIATLLITVLGLFFIASWYIRRKDNSVKVK